MATDARTGPAQTNPPQRTGAPLVYRPVNSPVAVQIPAARGTVGPFAPPPALPVVSRTARIQASPLTGRNAPAVYRPNNSLPPAPRLAITVQRSVISGGGPPYYSFSKPPVRPPIAPPSMQMPQRGAVQLFRVVKKTGAQSQIVEFKRTETNPKDNPDVFADEPWDYEYLRSTTNAHEFERTVNQERQTRIANRARNTEERLRREKTARANTRAQEVIHEPRRILNAEREANRRRNEDQRVAREQTAARNFAQQEQRQ